MKKLLVFILFSIYLIANPVIDIESKIKLAQEQGKEVVIFFHIPNCSYCAAMLDENFKNEEILAEIKKNYILVDMITSDESIVKFKEYKGDIKGFAKYLGAIAYPASIFLNNDKKILYRSIGYRNIQEQLMELMFISSKSYDKLTLEDFIVKTEFEMDD